MEISQESISAFIKYRIKNLKRTSFSTLEEYEKEEGFSIDDIAYQIKKQLPSRNKEDKVIAIAVLIESWDKLCFSSVPEKNKWGGISFSFIETTETINFEKNEWGISRFIIETIESSVSPEDFEDILSIYSYLRILSSCSYDERFYRGLSLDRYWGLHYNSEGVYNKIIVFGFEEQKFYLQFLFQELIDSYTIPGLFDVIYSIVQEDKIGRMFKRKTWFQQQHYVFKEICNILHNPVEIVSIDERLRTYCTEYIDGILDEDFNYFRFVIYKSLLYICPFQPAIDSEYLINTMLAIYDDAIDNKVICYLHLIVANKDYVDSYKSVFHNEHPIIGKNYDIKTSIGIIRKWYKFNHKEESVHTADITEYFAYEFLEHMEKENEGSERYQLTAYCFLFDAYLLSLREELQNSPNGKVVINNEEKAYKHYCDQLEKIVLLGGNWLSHLKNDDDPYITVEDINLLADICKEFLELIKNDNRIVLSEEQQHIIQLVTGEESLSEFKKFQKKILDKLCHPAKVAPSVHKKEGRKSPEKKNTQNSYPEIVPCGTKLEFPTNAALLSDRAKEIFIKRLVEELIDKGFIEVANDKIQIPEEDWYYYFGVRKEVPAEFWRGVHYKFIWKKAKQDLQHLMIKLYKKEKEEGTKVNWQAVEGVFRPQDKDRFVDLKNTSGIKKKIEENRANQLIEQAFSAALGHSIESKRKPRK